MVNWKNLVLGIAIFILTMFVGIYGINTFYGKAPQYDSYCNQMQPNNEFDCIKANGTWSNFTADPGVPAAPVKTAPYGSCDVYTYCNKLLTAAEEKYYKGAFMIALPLGIIVIALGLFVFALAPVGIGLMAGGVGLIIYGAGNYWAYANDVLKFLMSFVGLIVVVAMAYYFNKASQKKNFFSKVKDVFK